MCEMSIPKTQFMTYVVIEHDNTIKAINVFQSFEQAYNYVERKAELYRAKNIYEVDSSSCCGSMNKYCTDYVSYMFFTHDDGFIYKEDFPMLFAKRYDIVTDLFTYYPENPLYGYGEYNQEKDENAPENKTVILFNA